MRILMQRWFGRIGSILGGLFFILTAATPGHAHWADLAVAEIIVGDTTAQVTLVFPTGLVASADDNRDGRLSPDEVAAHRSELQTVLAERIRFTDGTYAGALTVDPADALPSNLNSAPGGHSTVRLTYAWPSTIQRLTISYRFFVPGVSTASCLATIMRAGKIQTFVFTPTTQEFSVDYGPGWGAAWRTLLTGIRSTFAASEVAPRLKGMLLAAAALVLLLALSRGSLRSVRRQGR